MTLRVGKEISKVITSVITHAKDDTRYFYNTNELFDSAQPDDSSHVVKQ